MKGCFNASAGVHLFSGLSAKHLSSKSANRDNSFVSASVRPFDADMRRVRRSRDGLAKARVLMVSCSHDISHFLIVCPTWKREWKTFDVGTLSRQMRKPGSTEQKCGTKATALETPTAKINEPFQYAYPAPHF